MTNFLLAIAVLTVVLTFLAAKARMSDTPTDLRPLKKGTQYFVDNLPAYKRKK